MSHNLSSVSASPSAASENNGEAGRYASQLLIRLSPSLIYRNLLLLIGLLALLAIFLIDVHLAFQLMLVLLLVLLLKSAWANNQSLDLHCNAQGEWLLYDGQQKLPVQLLAESVVTPRFAVLQFKTQRARRRSVVIFRDSLGEDDFRRLRVRLRVEGTQPVQRDTLG